MGVAIASSEWLSFVTLASHCTASNPVRGAVVQNEYVHGFRGICTTSQTKTGPETRVSQAQNSWYENYTNIGSSSDPLDPSLLICLSGHAQACSTAAYVVQS